MQIVIEIPDSEIPKNQELVHLSLHFIDRHICECSYPYMELPKGHGDLIDRSKLQPKLHGTKSIIAGLEAPTVIPADEESEE